MWTRRRWVGTAVGVGAAFGSEAGGLRIGVTDWNLKQTAKVDAVAVAKRLGFEGVQVSLGMTSVDGRLKLDDEGLQEQYRMAAAAQGMPIDGTCLDILHRNYLKDRNDPLGPRWVADGIRVTQRLGTQVMLLPFFGKGAITRRDEQERVGDVLRELAPEAQRAGVVMGLENTISAEDNVRILDRIGSLAALVYYDVGNSTEAGFDVVKEIRWLGRSRICQVHLKDNPHYLGEGRIDFPTVMRAIADIQYRGYANLETDAPSGDVGADLRRNLAYVRRSMGEG